MATSLAAVARKARAAIVLRVPAGLRVRVATALRVAPGRMAMVVPPVDAHRVAVAATARAIAE
jgi:hypothetical protein